MYKVIAGVVLLALVGCSGGNQGAGQGASARPAVGSEVDDAAPAVTDLRKGRSRPDAAFASLPDRGELFAFESASSAGNDGALREGAYTWRRIEISEDHAFRGIVDGHLRIPMPSGELLQVQYDRHVESPEGDWTWVGHLPGQPGVQTILTFGEHAVFGSIGQANGRPLRITMRNGAAWAVETDPTKLAGLASTGANPRAPDHLSVPKVRRTDGDVALAGAAAQGAAAATAATTIDVVIGYTPGFVTEAGNASAAATRLTYLVAVANQALSNSQVDVAFRVVRSMQVSYTDASTNDSTLEALTGYDSETQDYTNPDPAFNALRSAREQYGADMVTLVRGFRDPDHDGCGIAWLLGGGRSGIAPNDGQDYFAYSVVSDGYDVNEDDGQNYFCRDETLAHELGHNLGSQHDRGTADGDNGTLENDEYGVFTYSFGQKTAASAGNFYTVMSYGDQGQTDYRAFSNPRITFCGGRACGTTQYEDNARSIGQTAPIIAGYRATVVDPPPSGNLGQGVLFKQLDGNGDKRSDIFFYDHAAGRIAMWYMNGVSRAATSSVPYSASHRVVDTGDFDANGRTDLLLTSANRDVIVARSTGSSFTFVNTGLTYAADQQLLGLADVNGDGRSDILVRGSSNLVVWFMNGTSRYAFNSRSLSTALQYIGSGDFDGNGRQDLLWRDSGGNVYTSISNGSGFSTSFIGLTHAASYKLVGLQDVNGDGKSDMVLHDAAQRRMVVWFMNGSTRYAFNAHNTAAGFSIVGKGDFDGNRRGDILLQNAQGRVRYMLSSGSTFALALLPYVAQSNYQIMDLD